MATKKYILFSKWVIEPDWCLDRLRGEIFNQNTPTGISERVSSIIYTPRIIAKGWRQSWMLGRIGGSDAVVYDYFVLINTDGLSVEKQTAIDAFFVGFLVGRDSKKFT